MERTSSPIEKVNTRCCVVGGGPAGMIAGLLLTRAGVDVVVLEKHEDFFRDFRGDTIHPSTLELMYELGILDEFLRRPHQELPQLSTLSLLKNGMLIGRTKRVTQLTTNINPINRFL